MKKKKKNTSSRQEEDLDPDLCVCGTKESKTHIVVGECVVRNEERDALKEEMRKLDECNTEECGILEVSNENLVAIL